MDSSCLLYIATLKDSLLESLCFLPIMEVSVFFLSCFDHSIFFTQSEDRLPSDHNMSLVEQTALTSRNIR